ncbi:MAG: dTDP-4-dehydrorhamnose 3,5-epimerase family protein [Candidatus Curtissbacteria bacterium]|nr:dTDP-4-dehydrorhamnose 3,5-epimerase family protein [Candidatus Curtissbacteria bacterium]
MIYQYFNLNNQQDLIEGTIIRKLVQHTDPTGSLVETMRSDWTDVFGDHLPFIMQYMSKTPSGIARDEDKWHVHQKQEDRFICVSGRIVTALWDPRQDSKTKDKLNLFVMGPEKEEEMYMIVIPKEVYHGFMVISQKEGYLLNFPTQLYNVEDEGRIDNTQFSWQQVREDFGLK